jgi:hypothetical protein
MARRPGSQTRKWRHRASRAASAALVHLLAAELAVDGIGVMSVSPGMIASRRQEAQHAVRGGDQTFEQWRAEEVQRRRIAANRIGEATDVAVQAVMQVSPLSSYVIGADLEVSGGLGLKSSRREAPRDLSLARGWGWGLPASVPCSARTSRWRALGGGAPPSGVPGWVAGQLVRGLGHSGGRRLQRARGFGYSTVPIRGKSGLVVAQTSHTIT